MSFAPSFYVGNRQKLATECPNSLLVIAGNTTMQRNNDSAYQFRQESNFLYLTGIVEPNCALIMNTSTNEEFLMILQRTGVSKIFDGEVEPKELSRVSGISRIVSYEHGYAELLKQTNRKVRINAASKKTTQGLTINPHRAKIQTQLRRKGFTTLDIRPDIAKLRMIKQKVEIQAIEQAVAITKAAFAAAERSIGHAENEAQVLGAINAHFGLQTVGHGYVPIVASGVRATTLHYDANNKPLVPNGVVLLDIGAEFENYSADISRTYIKGANLRAQEIIDAVTRVQNKIIAAVKPGVTWRQLSETADNLVFEEIVALGLTDNKKDLRTYYPHAIGHFLGLDTHDAGDYSVPLRAGMVITIEPGIYVAKEAIGVRVEDDILVTNTGAKVL